MVNGEWMMPQAINGSRIIWPIRPTSTGLGRCAMSWKSCGLSVKPKSNIRIVKIGKTITIAFIPYWFYIVNCTEALTQ